MDTIKRQDGTTVDEEERDKWCEGRRWYDGNRGYMIIALGIAAVFGFALGGIIGFIIGRASSGC